MDKLESIFEKISAFSINVDEDVVIGNLTNATHMLDLNIKSSDFGADVFTQDDAEIIKTNIAEMFYNLIMIARKRRVTLDYVEAILEKKLANDMKMSGTSILVMQPRVKNTDNTGPNETEKAD